MKIVTLVSIAILQILVFSTRTSFADTDFEKFYGHYLGTALNETTDETANRAIEVTIKAHEQGFNVTWSTTVYRADNKVKKATFSINFHPRKLEGVYSSGMGKDLFGRSAPLDPLDGDPYIWAFIKANTMTVNSLLVSENGGYEIQTYERTLTGNGMSLVFSRVRNGNVMKQIRGEMSRVE